MNKPVVLQCRSLSKSFNEGEIKLTVLNDVDLTVHQAEMIAITGASGSGKSTLLHCLGGLDQPTSGEVRVKGQLINDMNEAQKSRCRNETLGFVYQFHHLLPEFNALENVMMPLLIRGVNAREAKREALQLIEHVGLIDRTKHRINELSGGERQRIAIARALVTKPQCLLADEPTGNLDLGTADHITQLLFELNKRLNTAFVIVTHNAALAAKMQRCYHLTRGELTLPT